MSIAATLDQLMAVGDSQPDVIDRMIAALAPAPVEFRTVADMRDAVLAATPPSQRVIDAGSAGQRHEHAMTVAGLNALRSGRGFVFGEFDLADDAYVELAGKGATAFIHELLGLPYATFCGLVELKIGGESRPVMIIAEEMPGFDEPGMEAIAGMRIYGVLPTRRPGGEVQFEPLSRASQVISGSDDYDVFFNKPIEPTAPGFETEMAEVVPRVLFAMLMLLSDDRNMVQRDIPSRQVNRARARHGEAAIPPTWRIDIGDAAYVTAIVPTQPNCRRAGGHHRTPIPHDRRGHQRRLPTGRLVWVRSCAVNGLASHLTRQRAFYQLGGGD